MAKTDNAEGATEAPTEAVAATAPDKRVRSVTVPSNFDSLVAGGAISADALTAGNAAGNTTQMPRADFIRKLASTNNYTRSDLTALTRIAAGDPTIKYQIIFQATKTMNPQPTWPQKVEAAPAAPATEAAPAA